MKLHANADDSSGALKHTLYWELEEGDYDFLDVPEKIPVFPLPTRKQYAILGMT